MEETNFERLAADQAELAEFLFDYQNSIRTHWHCESEITSWLSQPFDLKNPYRGAIQCKI